MKNPEIWKIWTETLNNPEYKYALQDSFDDWKLKHQEMCSFIKNSHIDPTKRKRPSESSKIKDEKRLGSWISTQKTIYDKTGPKQSLRCMKNPDIWNIWTNTLNNPEYKYALQDLDLIGEWKLKHQEICSFIKNSHIDPTKRKRPSQESKNSDEKRLGQWISHQKTNYKGCPEQSLKGMKNPDIWNIWTVTLNDPEYKYALQDSFDDWKLNHQEICSFIKNSNTDPTKRKCPSQESKNSDEKRLGKWISHQKTKYKGCPEQSLHGMKNPDIWNIWTVTLNDPEYKYALQNRNIQSIPQEDLCTSIFKSGVNKGKACGKKNCGVHKKLQNPNNV